MKKISIIGLAIMLSLIFALVNADAQPSSKATAKCTDLNVLESAAGSTTVFEQTIKTSEKKDLFIDVSFVVGLYTDTKVTSKGRTKSDATAEAWAKVKVLVDGKEADPGEVVFARRKQTLIGEFAGDLWGCMSIDDFGVLVLDQDCVQPETLELILETTSAHSFNFLAPDVQVGEHLIQVVAETGTLTGSASGDGQTGAMALIGKGSVTVDSVRMIKGEDVVLE